MKKYTFKAKLRQAMAEGLLCFFPYDTEKEFATEGKVPVKATFKSSLQWKPQNSNTRKILQTRPNAPYTFARASAVTPDGGCSDAKVVARHKYIRKKVKPKGFGETLQRLVLGEKE
jgi:hypothetical protein